MRIKLIDRIGAQCVSLDDGKTLYDDIFPELKEKRSVELDFSNVELVFSPFLMGALGKLLNYFEKETVMQRLVLCNISEEHLKTINDFLDRADLSSRSIADGSAKGERRRSWIAAAEATPQPRRRRNSINSPGCSSRSDTPYVRARRSGRRIVGSGLFACPVRRRNEGESVGATV